MLGRKGVRSARPTASAAAVALILCASLTWVAYAYSRSARAGALSLPTIHERFTLLPCEGRPRTRTTLQEEGCLEHQILATDKQLDATAKSIFALLATTSARRSFVAAQTAWLTFRRADCASVSSVFEGGTLAPLVDAECTVERNLERVKELRVFRSDLLGNA